jgi:hypothetical protein
MQCLILQLLLHCHMGKSPSMFITGIITLNINACIYTVPHALKGDRPFPAQSEPYVFHICEEMQIQVR